MATVKFPALCRCLFARTRNIYLKKTFLFSSGEYLPRNIVYRNLFRAGTRFRNSSYLRHWRALPLIGGGISGAIIAYYFQSFTVDSKSQSFDTEFTLDEVSKHKNKEFGIWVTYDGNVYDITDFVDHHPGGSSKILLAAGGALEPFWDMYAIHKKDEVIEILTEFKIGKLTPEDRAKTATKGEGPFAKDPQRHPALVANSKEPFNGETPPQLALDDLITPSALFFVRNHLPVPVVNLSSYKLHVSSVGAKPISLSLDDLKKNFKEVSVISTIQCAGNRRSEMNEIKKVKGLSWSSNAISNAEWTGVLLRDVLLHAGIDLNSEDSKHVHFEGLDIDPTKAPYGASIPIQQVLDPRSEVLLAYKMNGEPLPRDHGYPLRVVVPGVVGARNVKWLASIKVSPDESPSHWQQNDYKGFSPNIDWHNVDFKSAPAIQDSPVTSAICSPLEGFVVDEEEETVTVKGYAYSGGGRGVIRVDVSSDGGKEWHTASLKQVDQKLDRMWAWTHWEVEVPIPENHNGKIDICCKAVDSSYNTQPGSVSAIWNLRGVLNNSWFHVNGNVISED